MWSLRATERASRFEPFLNSTIDSARWASVAVATLPSWKPPDWTLSPPWGGGRGWGVPFRPARVPLEGSPGGGFLALPPDEGEPVPAPAWLWSLLDDDPASCAIP